MILSENAGRIKSVAISIIEFIKSKLVFSARSDIGEKANSFFNFREFLLFFFPPLGREAEAGFLRPGPGFWGPGPGVFPKTLITEAGLASQSCVTAILHRFEQKENNSSYLHTQESRKENYTVIYCHSPAALIFECVLIKGKRRKCQVARLKGAR